MERSSERSNQRKVKKIGITCYPTVGGSGVIATELGMMLAKRGYQVHFITSSMPFRLDQVYPSIYFHEVELNNYPVFQYTPYDLALASKMAEVIDQEKLDILHVHYAMPHAVSAILAKQIAKHPVQIVTTLHGTDITVLGIDQTFKNMIKYAIESSDAVTAVSNDLVEQTKSMLEVQKNIHVVYNFINEDEYYRKEDLTLRHEYGIADDEKVIIHISNFRKVKRIEDIIQMFYEVQKEVKAKLVLVGDGPLYSEMVQLVQSLNIDDKVLFLGKQKIISSLLSISDVKILLSEKESFGLVLLEAMACGVPTIGTDVGGIPEVIENGKSGYVVPLGDIEAAKNYTVSLLTNKNLYEQFRKNALNRAQTIFHSSEIVQQYIAIYEGLYQ